MVRNPARTAVLRTFRTMQQEPQTLAWFYDLLPGLNPHASLLRGILFYLCPLLASVVQGTSFLIMENSFTTHVPRPNRNGKETKMPKGEHPSGEEKGTRSQGTGSQGNQGLSDDDGRAGGGGSSANAQRANPDDASSIGKTHPPGHKKGTPTRGGRQGGGAGWDNSAGGVAEGGAFGREGKVSPGYVAGDPPADPTNADVVDSVDDL